MNATGKWVRGAVWFTFVGVMCLGCSPLTTIAFIFHKDEMTPTTMPLRPKTGPKHEKENELVVLLLVGQTETRPEFAGAYRDLATSLAKRLPEEAKENKDKISVIPQSKLDKFKISNPTWKAMHASTIGKKLGADVVMDINLGNMSLYQPGSANQIYEGTAEVEVQVYDATSTSTEPMHKYTHPHRYPTRTGMMAAGDIPVSRFRMMFLDRLALDLARNHLDHKQSDGIASEE